MDEPLLKRVRDLERSVRRWQRACFALAIVVVSLLAIGSTVGVMVLLEMPSIEELETLRAREQQARDEALRARQQGEQALQAEQALRKQRQNDEAGP
jgi:hypothetical protein